MGSALVRGCSASRRPSTQLDLQLDGHQRKRSEGQLETFGTRKSSIINNGAAACNGSTTPVQYNRASTSTLDTPTSTGPIVVIEVIPAQMDSPSDSASSPTEEPKLDRHRSVDVEKTAKLKLQALLRQLDNGVTPDLIELKDSISYAVDILANNCPDDSNEDAVLNSVSDKQVRAWLATTFTRHESVLHLVTTSLRGKERFKAIANTIIIGKYFENIVREPSTFTAPQYPTDLSKLFEERLDNWEFPIFSVETLAGENTLRYVGYEIFKTHNLFERCNISLSTFDNFLTRIEADYGNHGNPYHNAIHGADVAQTVHYLIQSTVLKTHLSHLEILAMILSAIVHDVDHPGTSNSFQITQLSQYALMYNDRSVLENHHLYHTFSLLQDRQYNILSSLPSDEYRLVRGLIIDMVLATDMSTHFEQLKQMKMTLSCPNCTNQLLVQDRSKTFSLMLHLADISHPGKAWDEHLVWSERLCKEFFRQGDLERTMGRSPSPLCDRENTNFPESQLGFIEYIVSPSYDVCGVMLETITADTASKASCDQTPVSHDPHAVRVWAKHIDNNKAMWKSKCKKKDKQEDTQEEAPVVRDTQEEAPVVSDTQGEAPVETPTEEIIKDSQEEAPVVENEVERTIIDQTNKQSGCHDNIQSDKALVTQRSRVIINGAVDNEEPPLIREE